MLNRLSLFDGGMIMADSEKLTKLRVQIDEIDNQILQMLERRQGLSREIVKQKVLGSDVFRPDREASLLRNLIASHQGIEASLICALWRTIISASIAEQKPDYLIAHSAKAKTISQNHAAGFLNEQAFEDAKAALAALVADTADCALIHHSELDDIAGDLGKNKGFVIISRTPLLALSEAEAGYIIAKTLPNPTGDDITISRDEAGQIHRDEGYLETPLLPAHEIIGIYAKPF